MADGVDIDLTGSPWSIAFHSGGGTALPATVVGVQKTTNIAMQFIPKRMVWVSPTAAAGDQVILEDIPGVGGTGTPRQIAAFVATGADFMPPQEWKRGDTESAFVGCQVSTMASGTLYIYV